MTRGEHYYCVDCRADLGTASMLKTRSQVMRDGVMVWLCPECAYGMVDMCELCPWRNAKGKDT